MKFEQYMDDYGSYKRFKSMIKKCNVCSCEQHCGHSCQDCETCPDCGCDDCTKQN